MTSDPPSALLAALAQLSEGVIVTDADGRITFVNEAAARLHGVAQLNVTPEAYSETYHLLTEAGVPYPWDALPLTRAVLHGETVNKARWRIRRADGVELPVVGSARPVLGPGGERLGAVLTVRDDSARVAVLAAERRATGLLDRMSDAHVTLDHTFRYVTVNAGAERSLGKSREELIGRTHWEVFPASLGTPLEAAYRRVAADGVEAHLTHHYVGEGYDVHLEIDAYPSGADGGAERGVAVFWRDVTTRVRASEAVAAMNAELAAKNAHLEAAETRLRSAFTLAPAAVAVSVGPEHRYVLANAQAEAVGGRGPLVGRTYADAFPEFVAQGFIALLDEVYATGEPFVGREVPVLLDRGGAVEHAWYDFVYQPMRDAGGAVTGILTHAVEVTAQVEARRRVEALNADLRATVDALAESEARFRAVYDASPNGFVLCRALRDEAGAVVDLRYVYANASAQHIIGRAPAAFVGRRVLDLFPHFGASDEFAAYLAVASGAPPYRGEQRSTLDGVERVDAVVAVQAGPDEVGIMFEDVTARVTASAERERLLAAERMAAERAALLLSFTAALSGALTREDVAAVVVERLAAALGAHVGVLALVTPDGRALAVAAAERLHVDTWRAWATFPLDTPVPLAQAARERRRVLLPTFDAIAADAPAVAEMCAAFGTHALCAVPIITGDRVLGALGFSFAEPNDFDDDLLTLLDTLTQQCAQALERTRLFEAERAARADAERARIEAEVANRAKGEFLAVMSHELRTPLNAIGGYAELIELGIHGPVTGEQRTALERIQRSQRHLLGLINGVLNYSRVEAGAVHYEIEDVPLDEVLAGCEALVAPQVRAKGLTLSHVANGQAPGARPVVARADRDKVQQVVLNLLSNAVKFTASGGSIGLGVQATATAVRVQVTDTGRGIPTDQLERVFQPFVQVDAKLTRTQEGTGLGLAISRDLARGMGGDLTAESTPGVGSIFTLTLPPADEVA